MLPTLSCASRSIINHSGLLVHFIDLFLSASLFFIFLCMVLLADLFPSSHELVPTFGTLLLFAFTMFVFIHVLLVDICPSCVDFFCLTRSFRHTPFHSTLSFIVDLHFCKRGSYAVWLRYKLSNLFILL